MPSPQRAVPGTIVGGRYQLRAAIGNGGMGTVWQAVDTVLRRDVAVKEVLLPPGMPPAERTAMYERTFREGRAAAALSHPSVVQVYDVVTENGRPWIIMELLQARSLSEIIISDGPIAGRAVAKIGIALLGALEVAHAAGVLHRDVKPANVLICADGRCVLTDFGVARMPAESNLTQPGMVLGSPHFISPERAVGAAFGPPSDLFSLGVTLYTAAEGRPPFDRGDPFETMRAIVEEPPAPPVRSGVLAPVLMGLLEKDPALRWTVVQARQALRELVSGALTNRAPQHVTDPPAATPTQPAVLAGQIVANAPDGGSGGVPPDATGTPAGAPPRLGGRALLADDESVADRLGSDGRFATSDRAGRATRPAPAQRTAAGDQLDPTQPGPPVVTSGAAGAAGRGAPSGGRTAPAGGGPLAGVLASGSRLWNYLRGLPAAVQLGSIIGAAVIAVVLVIVTAGGPGGSPPVAQPSTGPSASAAAPGFPVQSFHDPRGITINVPAAWKEQKAASYTNFYDPANSNRRLRINVEASGRNTPSQFLAIAEHSLKTRGSCPGYQRVAVADTTLDGRVAAQLEYTCGSGADMRHGLWAVTTENAHAYHFYLTVPETDFATAKPIFNEMVSSFKLDPPAN